ncbi:MAG TPA: OsmC family peroxiredoxin [Chromatiales bacterium]|nr:OsmC family peroxiredoxin [Chromatiales bacterium]
MSEEPAFTIHLEQLEDYAFTVRFDWDRAADLTMDEPSPLGQQQGPNAVRLLAAAAANCLSASLLFCLYKNEPPATGLRVEASGSLARNEQGRLRVSGLAVRIRMDEELSASQKLRRCLDLFEDFCVVTASLRDGIPVQVQVIDHSGKVVRETD